MQVSPHNKYGQPEDAGVERAGNFERVENPETKGGQQERVEGRPTPVNTSVVANKAFSGQQVSGDGYIFQGIPMQPHAIADIPRQHQGNAQQG